MDDDLSLVQRETRQAQAVMREAKFRPTDVALVTLTSLAVLYTLYFAASIILPFVLFSPTAGWLADRFSKRRVIIWTLAAQVAVWVLRFTGVQAITLARVRHMPCDPAYTDFNREKEQQQIMTGIKNQLFSLPAFIHLPWASWDAPKSIQTDMGPVSLMQLFIASEIGGSSAPVTLGGSFGSYGGADVVIPNQSEVATKVQKLMTGQ